ncbi:MULTISPECIES: hypothetical protein [unclassified Frankia]|nr:MULTISPECIES: hypothetical protein [unclassified Frankia]
MTSTTTEPVTETIADKPADTAPVVDEALARRLVEQAKARGCR